MPTGARSRRLRVAPRRDSAPPCRRPAGGRSFETASGKEARTLHYLVIEHFRNGDPVPVYRRFRERGRLAPPGLHYVGSWVTEDLSRCYQIMETENPALLDEWLGQWADLVDFEVMPVLTSAQAQQRQGL